MGIEEFLENSAYGWESAGMLPQLQEAYSDVEKMDPQAWVRKWAPVIMDTPELTSDFYESKLLNTVKPIEERLTQAFGSSDKENPFKKSDKWINQLYWSEFSDVPRETFDAALKKQSNYWDDFKKEREMQAAKAKREKEVKEDWTPLTKNPDVSTLTGLSRWLLGSDYEKQRYINEPEKAIIGQQAETNSHNFFNKGDAISDMAFGAAGAAGDMIPYAGIVAGPAARAARDVYHKVTDSPYQKSWGDIAADAGTDALLNAGVDLVPNFRQYLRMFNFGSRMPAVKKISDAMQLEDDVKALLNPEATALAKKIDASLSFMSGNPRPEMPKNSEIKKIVEEMPESPMKQELLPLVADPQAIDADVIAKTIQHWQSAASQFYKTPAEKAAVKKEVDDHNSHLVLQGAMDSKHPLFSRIYLADPLSVTEKAAKGALRGAETFLKSTPGAVALKGSATARGRGKAPEVSPEAEQAWYLDNYARDWDMGFKPGKADRKEGSPKWEAYKQWHLNKYGELPEED